ncbi:hypothetical protein C8R21_1412 [Nitrosospira multiformis]|uniref:Uncharacterized protein n=2 Tax=Nitrosospira multiformis TaxID=1231 RepID=A0A2T5I4G2_9PROT|nr:hypothetical protein C8R21_1412 [Nitrosospira multiformis]
MIGKILEASFHQPEHQREADAFCAKIIEAIRNHKVFAWDLDKTINALTKTFPLTVLDVLVEQAMDDYGLTIFQDMRSVNRSCPLDIVSDELLISWAARKPNSRYTCLARVVKFLNQGDEDDVGNWSASAEKLIEVAPEPSKVLDVFLNRFGCQGRGSSLAATLVSRIPLIESLVQHSNSEIATWAERNAPSYAAMIERQRATETAEDRARDEKFE